MKTQDGPDLEAAYALDGVEANRQLYARWAETYDTSFAETHGYRLPETVVRGFLAAGGAGPVLDLGAGTGLVGQIAARSGLGPVDGTDLSAEMLAVAEGKGVYRRLFPGDLLGRLDVATGAYAGVVSAGTFTNGHVGPEALGEVLRIMAPGALACLSVNAVHYERSGFGEALGGMRGVRLRPVDEVPIYAPGKAPEGHVGDTAFLVVFERL